MQKGEVKKVKESMTLRRCVFALSALAALVGFQGAQNAAAQDLSKVKDGIVVTVRDASGVAIKGAQLTIKNLGTDTTLSATSDAAGTYQIKNLAPGSYEISAVKYGFAEAKTRLVLASHRQAQAELKLKLAAVAEEVAPPELKKVDNETKRLEMMEAQIAQLQAELRKKNGVEPTDIAQPNPAEATAQQKAATQEPSFDTPVLIPRGPLVATLAKDQIPVTAAALGSPDLSKAVATTAGPNAAPQQSALPPTANATPGTDSSAAPTAQNAAPTPPAVDLQTPFADYDWTWLNGNPRNHDVAFDSKFFTPEIRSDVTYTYDFNRPIDDSMGGSSELFRSNEIQLEQLGLGGDFHWDNVRARFMTQFGAYSTATIRNDGSYSKGQWDLADADRYLAEAYGGYHINWMHGMNIDAGIFMSYIGLFSYYNFDNWAYQPSYVSSNTPWFFQGIRIQIFPTNHMKIEPWIINGWQSYGSANTRKGLGGQFKWTPFSWFNIISNNYGFGHDDLYTPHRERIHTDNSFEIKYYDRPQKGGNGIDKMAVTFTGDLGCEYGDGVNCHNDKNGNYKQSFVGFMLYDRTWWRKDTFAFTLGGGMINNPGRYLVLIPPINGESASSAAINSPYFPMNPGDPFKAWDVSGTFDYMPRQWLTFRFEGDFRHSNVPYWSGHNGMTPPAFAGAPTGVNNGYPEQYACMDGTPSGSQTLTPGLCSNDGGVWFPNLRTREWLVDIDVMVKF